MSALVSPLLSVQGIVSYAQNFEDVMLWRALQGVSHGFYIDVGAQSPDTDSVTKAFSLAGWRGVNVEPHPSYFEQLCIARPNDINLNIALGERSGSVTMSLVENSGLSTADEQIAAQHAAAGHLLRRHSVDMLTLAAAWKQYVPEGQAVHFLKVDVEGLEKSVLAGNDWRMNRPWIVLVEATLPNSQVEVHEEWESILLDAGYVFSYADGLNRFYVAKEHAHLCAALKYPPNVFDHFTTARELALQERADSVEERLTAESAAHSAVQRAAEEAAEKAAEKAVDEAAEWAAERAAQKAAQDLAAQESGRLRRELLVLGRAFEESMRRVECTEASAIQAREREMALRDQLDTELAALRTQISPYNKWLRDEKDKADALKFRAEAFEQQYLAVTQSLSWRITRPARAVLARLPSRIKRNLRRVAKAVWWAATPWHLPARWRAIQGRGRTLPVASATDSIASWTLDQSRGTSVGGAEALSLPPLVREIADRREAARWCLDLLRSSPEIRRRFPLALSMPASSGFIDWIHRESGTRFGLCAASQLLVTAVLKEDFGARVRQTYNGRPDVRAACPNGLQPQGQAALYRWFMQFGCAECNLAPEEVHWFFAQASEGEAQIPEQFPRLSLDTYVLAQGIKTGVYRVCDELFPLLVASDQLNCRLYVRPHDEAKAASLAARLGAPLHSAPAELPSADADILLSPFGVAPSSWAFDGGVLHAHIVYDLIGVTNPEFFSTEAAAEVRRIMDSLDRQTVIFAISEFTKTALLSYRPDLEEKQVQVIPLAAGSRFHPCEDQRERARVRAKYGIPAGVPYVLSLATLEIRKNLDQVVRALVTYFEQHADGEVHLVLSGMSGWKLEQLDEALAKFARWRHRIVLTGFIEDADLSALYSDALCFIYLSRAEGFGLPPLEAMACGTPVICADNTSLPEVVGQAGLLFDADDVEGVANALARIASSPNLRQQLAEAGLGRARLFSWSRCAEIIAAKLLAVHAERGRARTDVARRG